MGKLSPLPSTMTSETKWLLGVGGTWVILSLMVDLGAGDLAVALALTMAGSVVLAYGPDVFKSLGISTVAPASGGK